MADRFQPLETPRLHLEPITPQVARQVAAGDLAGLEAAEGWPHEDTKDAVALAIKHGHPAGWFITHDGRIIGDCGTHGPVDDNGCVEIGYGLAGPSRGQGFGTEAVLAISEWLLAQPDVRTVRARTVASNVASRRVLEKARFKMVGAQEDGAVYERCS